MLYFLLIICIYLCSAHNNVLYKPSGKYCGTISSLIEISATVKSDTRIDLDMHIFGKDFQCHNEYIVLHADNTIEFPNSYNRLNCIYKIFNEFGRTSITFQFDSSNDMINVGLEIGILEMRRCNLH